MRGGTITVPRDKPGSVSAAAIQVAATPPGIRGLLATLTLVLALMGKTGASPSGLCQSWGGAEVLRFPVFFMGRLGYSS